MLRIHKLLQKVGELQREVGAGLWNQGKSGVYHLRRPNGGWDQGKSSNVMVF